MPIGKKSGVAWTKINKIGGVIKGEVASVGGTDELIWVGGGENGFTCWAKGSAPIGCLLYTSPKPTRPY